MAVMTINEMKYKLGEVEKSKAYTEKALTSREVLNAAVEYVYDLKHEAKPKNASLLELIDNTVVSDYIDDRDIISSLHYARILGMNAKHGIKPRKKEAETAFANVSFLVDLLDKGTIGIPASYKKPPYMSEAETRKLYINQYLREAGWDVLDQENIALPGKAGIEIEVHGMPNAKGKGYCDYVLYGKNGFPLAIVEVKKTSVAPETGRHQVQLYGDCMKAVYGYKPILYYTNGYVTKIIDGIYPDREVTAFHTLEELELMLQRRKRGSIVDMTINSDIAGRPYQRMAITNICEWLNANHRQGLLVMATGTGKTRTAISLVDVLTRNKWVKNVLFLADRTTLVHQAKKNFAKILPNMSVCELSGSGEKDYNARLMFSTYQTMINYIDSEDKRFTTGRFDLIITDEAHRSIFNRYGTIFKYFDSLLIGLTATPKNEVDANTYRIFGCEAGVPNFDYSLEEAIKDHYLVGYRVINRTSKLLTEGIDYNALTPEQKQTIDQFLDEDPPTPDFNIPGNEIFRHLYNTTTCDKVLDELMRWGLRVDGGEVMGKTIIFAYNHKHAQMIVDRFNALYPLYPEACQLIDNTINYANDLVEKFETDDTFRIAVSVDMLDTGVDIPEVLNLVFFKPVRSQIKFIQMIGRGTRLCENVYGPGLNKQHFQIFDYCDNFRYFGIHPNGKDGKETLTLTQRRFQVKLNMLFELQRLEYQEDAYLSAYYSNIKNELHGEVVKIKNNEKRIQVRKEMQYVDKFYDRDTWVSLSPSMIKEANAHILPLLDSGTNGEYLSVAFDIRMFLIELSKLTRNDLKGAAKDVKQVRRIAQYLLAEKASVPAVLAKVSELKELRDDDFWSNPQVHELEEKRESLRDLMHLLITQGKNKFDITIDDVITESEYVPEDTVIDIRTYRQKVEDYLKEHSNSPAVAKIYNLEPINADDLTELEHVLWHELGTYDEYSENTDVQNLAAFVRSIIGLNQDAINEKFGEYLTGNFFNAQQQEFVKTIINYVRENGDVELADMVNTEPFNNYDLVDMFGNQIQTVVSIVNMLHGTIAVS